MAELAFHPRLDEKWRDLLPRILAFNGNLDAAVAVESYRPGIDLSEAMVQQPHRIQELTAAALAAIAPLHRRTATRIVVDDVCLLRRWVGEPLAGLTEMCTDMDSPLVPIVHRLDTMLREALVGRRLAVGWTHGDYAPGNVRLAAVDGPVVGILDWGGARPGRLALIDNYLMTLSASRQIEGAELGAVVAARLHLGGLLDRERNALRAVDQSISVDERTAILLTWLHYVVDMCRKCTNYRDDRTWWAANVSPVLRAVAELSGSTGGQITWHIDSDDQAAMVRAGNADRSR